MPSAHIAIIGAPMDLGAGRRGVDMGPSAIRLAGLNEKLAQLGRDVVDCGNVTVDQAENLPPGPANARYLPQIAHTCERVAAMVTKAIGDQRMPLVLGGDHSVTYPLVRAFERFGPLDIVHFDAHLDWIDHVVGIKFANGSPFRRISELPFVRHMTHLGIRDLRSREGLYQIGEALPAVSLAMTSMVFSPT